MEIEVCKDFLYRVQIGDDLKLICARFNTCKENIVRNNEDLDLYAGEWICVKRNDFITYIVKPAETIKEIAEKMGVSVEKIKKDNNLLSEKLFIGQMLKIY